MTVAFVGLGKLGLPCALAVESRGHEVLGVDPSPHVAEILTSRLLPYREADVQPLLESTLIRLVPIADAVARASILFVAVQTPHDPRYEGITPVPATRADFSYAHLCDAVREVATAVRDQPDVERTMVVISTVLPGTVARYVRPILRELGVEGRLHLVYNPFFIAMGTTLHDFLRPEFVLLGTDARGVAARVERLYASLHDRPVFPTSIENAELAKVAYNTFIGIKIAFANTLMEVCHKIPNTDVDDVVDALSLATDRLVSPRYLRGGMGDGGGCHPRDNIALSWLAQRLDLSHDLFADVMGARDDQTRWLADLVVEEKKGSSLPVVLLGMAFKGGTNLTTGSPALLLSHYLRERGVSHHFLDPEVEDCGWSREQERPRAIFFVSTRHDHWRAFGFPEGSVVLDPFRYLDDNPSIKRSRYVPIGRGPERDDGTSLLRPPPVARAA